MAITLTIDSTDRTRKVSTGSIKIENILNSKRDTCAFAILDNTGDNYLPRLGAEVVVMDGATKIFAGVITELDSVPVAYGIVRHQIRCQDYTRLLDHRLVPDSFENQTINQIITYLKNNYFPRGFTLNNVDADIEVKKINFNYRPLSKCLDDLAKLVNYDWYVDYDKDLHFFAKEITPAPFDIADETGTYRYDTLIIRRDNTQIRNSIIVRGGEYLGSQLTTELQTDGVRSMYNLPYKFADFDATLTGTNLNLGIDNIDDPDSFDALYNFQEKLLKFKEADRPNSGKTITISGKPYLPVIVRYRSPTSIAAMVSAESNPTFTSDGIYEYLIEDRSIQSKEAARQRAQAEILAYAQTLSEGEFVTETSGLRAGMSIRINSTSRGIDETFIINKVSTTQFSKDTFLYNVSLITTRTNDLIEILQRLLLESTRKLEIDPNETSDIVFSFEDGFTFSDQLGTFSTHGTEYRWGPDSNQGRWNFATWS